MDESTVVEMKNNFKYSLFIFVLLFVSGVRGQTLRRDSTEVITEPVEMSPFTIKRKSVYANLPIKLRGVGLGVIKLFVNNRGELLNMSIQKLKIRLKNGTNIDFYSTDSLPNYPKQIKKYYKPLRKYVDDMKIVPISKTNIPSKTSVTLIVRFKQNPPPVRSRKDYG